MVERSRGDFPSRKAKKGLSTGGVSVDSSKKTEITPIPETQIAWVQNSSYRDKLRLIFLWWGFRYWVGQNNTYLVINLHFKRELFASIGMLAGVMELDVL
jgi:hypothetical protein